MYITCTIWQIRNMISCGVCVGFRYKDMRWWSVTGDGRLKRISRNGLTFGEYIFRNNFAKKESRDFTARIVTPQVTS